MNKQFLLHSNLDVNGSGMYELQSSRIIVVYSMRIFHRSKNKTSR